MTLVPETTDSGLMLGLCCSGSAFPAVNPVYFAATVAGLSPGPQRLRLTFQGRHLDTLVTLPAGAP